MATIKYDELSTDVKRTIQGIRGIEEARAQIEQEFQRAVYNLETRYAMAYQAVYDRRKAIIMGNTAVTHEEVAAGEEKSLSLNPHYVKLPATPNAPSATPFEGYRDQTPNPPKATPIKGFWAEAMANHHEIGDTILVMDEPALKHLVTIDVIYPDMNGGLQTSFGIRFEFSPNKYFFNETLTVAFVYKSQLNSRGTFHHSHIIGDIIRWKVGFDLIRKAKKPKARDQESFFAMFMPPPLIQKPQNERELNRADRYERRYILDNAFEIGEAFKQTIVPRAVDYFAGQEGEDWDEGEDDLDEDEDDYDEGEDDYYERGVTKKWDELDQVQYDLAGIT